MEGPAASGSQDGLWLLWQAHRLSRALRLEVRDELAGLGIDSLGLGVLAFAPVRPYPTQLADALAVPPATISRAIAALEARGLVTREQDPGDGRRRRVVVTDAGTTARQRGEALLDDAVTARLGRLDPDLRRLLPGALRQLADTDGDDLDHPRLRGPSDGPRPTHERSTT